MRLHLLRRRGQHHIDVRTTQLVLDPGRFDVIAACHLFGDVGRAIAQAVAFAG